MEDKIIDFKNTRSFKKKQAEKGIPVFSQKVSAGSLTTVNDDHIENTISYNLLDLDSLRGRNLTNLTVVTISGDSMYPILKDQQKVIIDTSLPFKLTPEQMKGKVVIARYDDEMTIKRFDIGRKYFFLVPENKNYQVIKVPKTYDNFSIYGVMTDTDYGLF